MKKLMILALFAPVMSFAATTTTDSSSKLEQIELKPTGTEAVNIEDINFDKEFSDEELQGLFIEEDADAPQTTQGTAPESDEETLDF